MKDSAGCEAGQNEVTPEGSCRVVESGDRNSNEAPELAVEDIGENSCGDMRCVGDAVGMAL